MKVLYILDQQFERATMLSKLIKVNNTTFTIPNIDSLFQIGGNCGILCKVVDIKRSEQNPDLDLEIHFRIADNSDSDRIITVMLNSGYSWN